MAKILVVDDSNTVFGQMRADLEKGGHQVLQATSGEEGIAKVQELGDSLQLLISDFNMPGMNGMEMIRALRGRGYNSLPVFIITTKAVADVRDEARGLGVKAWITKPYSAAKLLEAIDKIVPAK